MSSADYTSHGAVAVIRLEQSAGQCAQRERQVADAGQVAPVQKCLAHRPRRVSLEPPHGFRRIPVRPEQVGAEVADDVFLVLELGTTSTTPSRYPIAWRWSLPRTRRIR